MFNNRSDVIFTRKNFTRTHFGRVYVPIYPPVATRYAPDTRQTDTGIQTMKKQRQITFTDDRTERVKNHKLAPIRHKNCKIMVDKYPINND